MIEHSSDPVECKNELISHALSAGGYDNVTVAMCSIMMDEPEEVVKEEQKAKDIPSGKEGAEMEEKETAKEGEVKETDEEASIGKPKDAETEEEKELSATLRPKVYRRWPKVLLYFLFLLVAAGVFIYYYPNCEPVRQQIASFFNDIILKVKQIKI
jgi:hypothetical protein